MTEHRFRRPNRLPVPENIKFDPEELYVLYIASVFYENEGSPGLDEQDDCESLTSALYSAIIKLQGEAAPE